jgi:hypothetical protein
VNRLDRVKAGRAREATGGDAYIVRVLVALIGGWFLIGAVLAAIQ